MLRCSAGVHRPTGILRANLTPLSPQYSDADLLHARFVAAARTPGGAWVQYLWPTRLADGSFMATRKESYVVGDRGANSRGARGAARPPWPRDCIQL